MGNSYTDSIELDGQTLVRTIIPEEDPKCGVIVATEYRRGGNLIRRDIHIEVSVAAMKAGMTAQAGKAGK